MSVQMLRARIALRAAVVLAIIFLVWIRLDCSLPLLRGWPLGGGQFGKCGIGKFVLAGGTLSLRLDRFRHVGVLHEMVLD